MLLSVLGCFLISLAAITTSDFDKAFHPDSSHDNFIKTAKLEGQLCFNDTLTESGSKWAEPPANTLGILLIFLGLFLTGFGNTVYFSLSVSYLDDNVSRRASPFMLAISMLVRILGPFLGIALASACLRFYVDPRKTPSFNEDDPRWVGAWWMGTPILACLTLILAFLVAMFPKRLPIKAKHYQ